MGGRDLIDRRHLKESGISGCYERVVCVLSVNYTLQFINSRLASPSITSLGRFKRPISVFFFKAQIRCQNPYFELDFEQDAMSKFLLIKQETE